MDALHPAGTLRILVRFSLWEPVCPRRRDLALVSIFFASFSFPLLPPCHDAPSREWQNFWKKSITFFHFCCCRTHKSPTSSLLSRFPDCLSCAHIIRQPPYFSALILPFLLWRFICASLRIEFWSFERTRKVLAFGWILTFYGKFRSLGLCKIVPGLFCHPMVWYRLFCQGQISNQFRNSALVVLIASTTRISRGAPRNTAPTQVQFCYGDYQALFLQAK